MTTSTRRRDLRASASTVVVAIVSLAGLTGTSAGAATTAPEKAQDVTAIEVRPLHDAQVVRGDDGKDHVEYDLLVVSVFDAPVTLTKVTVFDSSGRQLGVVDGDTLTAATQELFSHTSVPSVPASGVVAVEVDLTVAPGKAPSRVTNQIDYTVPADAISAPLLGATEVHGPAVDVDRSAAFVIERPPLAGDGWLATSACCTPNPHRDLRVAVDGLRIDTGETFAVDWGKLEGDRLYDGQGSTNVQHYAFGADVLAVADGTVVFAHDGEPEQTPGEVKLATRAAAIGGNKVILKIAPKVFAAYEHLSPGTLKVKVGDKVKAGAVLAQLGNTGPSTGAHLHFGLLDRPDIFSGRSVPFVFDHYTLAGTTDLATAESDTLVIRPESREVRKAYPLVGSIQNFSE